jgi:hypothetical protein
MGEKNNQKRKEAQRVKTVKLLFAYHYSFALLFILNIDLKNQL